MARRFSKNAAPSLFPAAPPPGYLLSRRAADTIMGGREGSLAVEPYAAKRTPIYPGGGRWRKSRLSHMAQKCDACGADFKLRNRQEWSEQSFKCQDGCTLTFCMKCVANMELLEHLLDGEGQDFIIPPDSVPPISLIAQHGGVSFRFRELPW